MEHVVRILEKKYLNHNVIQFRMEKPAGYSFLAGQAIELTLDAPERKGPAPFTLTCLNSQPYLELTIKIYRDRKGITSALEDKPVGDNVILTDPWDSFINKGAGVFIAGGAGVTPFIAILRQLKKDNQVGDSRLFFSNTTALDVFLDDEFKTLLGKNYLSIITGGGIDPSQGRIDAGFLKKNISDHTQPVYICGPPGFVDSIQGAMTSLGTKNELINVSF